MSTPRKDPIPNQDKKIIGLKKYQCLTPDVPPFFPGNKALINEQNDDSPETSDTSQSEEDDTFHTKQDDYIENVKEMNTNDYEK